jgi:uncharacterized protein (DUF169 family)
MDLSGLSEQLTNTLQLASPPVSLAFMDEAPAGVSDAKVPVPSSCAFWIQAEERLFFAPAVLHENCPVGVLVMGFPMGPEVISKLNEFVAKMCNALYLGKAEPESIPRIAESKKGILYGPLSKFPQLPDLTLVWVNGRQAMLLEEALGSVCWNTAPRLQALGRPACAALALAKNQNRSTVSLGCSGMRTFTSIGEDKLLISIPGLQLESLPDRLETARRANETMLDFYRQHQTQFTIGV